MERASHDPKRVGQSRPLFLFPYRGMIQAEWDDPELVETISKPEKLLSYPGAKILLESRNRVGQVPLTLSSGERREIVVKEFSSRGAEKLKSLFRPSKASRAWKGALTLVERGLRTPSPVAYLDKKSTGLVERCFFLAEKVSGGEEVRSLFRNLSPKELRPLLASLGSHLRLCHDLGILHRDLSDGNILVKKGEGEHLDFFFLDTNRIRDRIRKPRRLRRLKNLIRLGVPRSHQHFFLQAYLGKSPLRKSDWLWYRINKDTYAWYVRVKKKLRLRQIARRLRIQ